MERKKKEKMGGLSKEKMEESLSETKETQQEKWQKEAITITLPLLFWEC